MSSIFSPVMQVGTQQWMLGKIEDGTARPLTRLEIQAVVTTLDDSEKTEQLWQCLEELVSALTADEGEDHAGVVLHGYIAGLHRMLNEARVHVEGARQLALAADGAGCAEIAHAAQTLVEEIGKLRELPQWGSSTQKPVDEEAVALEGVKTLLGKFKPLQLPVLVIVGLPKTQRTIRMSGGLRSLQTRAIFAQEIIQYFAFLDNNPNEQGLAK